MRKLLLSIGAIVVFTAAAVFIWSHTALVPIHASTASVSPIEMMKIHKPALPTETWEPF